MTAPEKDIHMSSSSLNCTVLTCRIQSHDLNRIKLRVLSFLESVPDWIKYLFLVSELMPLSYTFPSGLGLFLSCLPLSIRLLAVLLESVNVQDRWNTTTLSKGFCSMSPRYNYAKRVLKVGYSREMHQKKSHIYKQWFPFIHPYIWIKWTITFRNHQIVSWK